MVAVGAWLVSEGRLDAGLLPLATLLAMASFLPISEISHTARQLADTLGATRRVFAVHSEVVEVQDGPGVAPSGHHRTGSIPALAMTMPILWATTNTPLRRRTISVDSDRISSTSRGSLSVIAAISSARGDGITFSSTA